MRPSSAAASSLSTSRLNGTSANTRDSPRIADRSFEGDSSDQGPTPSSNAARMSRVAKPTCTPQAASRWRMPRRRCNWRPSSMKRATAGNCG
ncbi:Uncharacterised protein [Acinetobacter baumannii]|nr:Uncharacterised protein [Acinetobacter baumannii]